MKVEGITETSAPQLTGNAFEQSMPVRTAMTQRAESPASNAPHESVVPPIVVDTHDSSAAATPGQQVEYKAPTRTHTAQGVQGVVDRDGDGRITLADLPFDYFQISRQASRKLITPPATDIPF